MGVVSGPQQSPSKLLVGSRGNTPVLVQDEAPRSSEAFTKVLALQ